jgi:hypothetical protein
MSTIKSEAQAKLNERANLYLRFWNTDVFFAKPFSRNWALAVHTLANFQLICLIFRSTYLIFSPRSTSTDNFIKAICNFMLGDEIIEFGNLDVLATGILIAIGIYLLLLLCFFLYLGIKVWKNTAMHPLISKYNGIIGTTHLNVFFMPIYCISINLIFQYFNLSKPTIEYKVIFGCSILSIVINLMMLVLHFLTTLIIKQKNPFARLSDV